VCSPRAVCGEADVGSPARAGPSRFGQELAEFDDAQVI
jgi:hypothetical protein